MSKVATVSFTTQPAPKPSGVEIGGFDVKLLSKDPTGASTQVGATINVPDETKPVTITIADAGDYAVSVVRVAVSGDAVSAAVESPVFTVPPDMIAVPLNVTVVLGDPMAVPATVAATVAP
jgi:hypothetical protein